MGIVWVKRKTMPKLNTWEKDKSFLAAGDEEISYRGNGIVLSHWCCRRPMYSIKKFVRHKRHQHGKYIEKCSLDGHYLFCKRCGKIYESKYLAD